MDGPGWVALCVTYVAITFSLRCTKPLASLIALGSQTHDRASVQVERSGHTYIDGPLSCKPQS